MIVNIIIVVATNNDSNSCGCRQITVECYSWLRVLRAQVAEQGNTGIIEAWIIMNVSPCGSSLYLSYDIPQNHFLTARARILREWVQLLGSPEPLPHDSINTQRTQNQDTGVPRKQPRIDTHTHGSLRRTSFRRSKLSARWGALSVPVRA